MATFAAWLEGKGVAIPGEPGQLARYWRDSKGKRPRASGVDTISRWILADTDRIDPNITMDGANAAMVTLTELYHRAQAGHLGAAQQEAATGRQASLDEALRHEPPPEPARDHQQQAQAADGPRVCAHGVDWDENYCPEPHPPGTEPGGSHQQQAQAADAPAEAQALLGHQQAQRRQLGQAGAWQQPDPAAAADDPPYQDRVYAQQSGPAADGWQPGPLTGPPLVQEIRTEWHEAVTSALTHIVQQLSVRQASDQHIRGLLGMIDAKLAQILDWQADVDWQAAQDPGEALEAAFEGPAGQWDGQVAAVVDSDSLAAGIGQQVREAQAAGPVPWLHTHPENALCVPPCPLAARQQPSFYGRPVEVVPQDGPPHEVHATSVPRSPGPEWTYVGETASGGFLWTAPPGTPKPLQPWTQEPDGPYGINEVPGG